MLSIALRIYFEYFQFLNLRWILFRQFHFPSVPLNLNPVAFVMQPTRYLDHCLTSQ